MEVNFYATLRTIAGGKTIRVNPNGASTARAVLQVATEGRPELAAEIWNAEGMVNSHIHVLVNGRQVEFLGMGLETPLAAGDQLDIFPAIGGG